MNPIPKKRTLTTFTYNGDYRGVTCTCNFTSSAGDFEKDYHNWKHHKCIPPRCCYVGLDVSLLGRCPHEATTQIDSYRFCPFHASLVKSRLEAVDSKPYELQILSDSRRAAALRITQLKQRVAKAWILALIGLGALYFLNRMGTSLALALDGSNRAWASLVMELTPLVFLVLMGRLLWKSI